MCLPVCVFAVVSQIHINRQNMSSLVRLVGKFGPALGACAQSPSPTLLGSTRTFLAAHQRPLSSQPHPQPSPQAVFEKVNTLITSKDLGQTFAVIHLYGRQYIVHLGDIISTQKAIPAEVGEKIKLEKCLLLGNADFTLVGRPVLNRDLVQVEATVIEKTMSQTYFNMYSIPRNRGYRRYRFFRNPLSMLRISEITVCHPLNSTQKRIN